ncbi:avidin-like [Acipenser ruthenus]|uniref:avidin-like n=1 Tax=Acipenser ruthenus TaxID=7906 RepID=UPI002740D47E|nr:avidin-like [Acipenser ruthenus]
MKNMILFLTLILLFQVAFYNCHEQKCDLTGKWVNELGSNMTISKTDDKGHIFGSYFITLTANNGVEIKESPLSGIKDDSHQPIFGFLVKWTFSESITNFVGQCFVDKNGVERLETMWLLRTKADSSGANWEKTRVGSNLFHRLAIKK